MLEARVSGANLSRANLINAFLNGADLSGADLSGANLSGAFLSLKSRDDWYWADQYWALADPEGANLSGALGVSGAFLRETDLSGADLSGAFLNGVRGWTEEGLGKAESLEGATIDGQKYEDLLKSKGHGEDGGERRPS